MAIGLKDLFQFTIAMLDSWSHFASTYQTISITPDFLFTGTLDGTQYVIWEEKK